MGMMMLARARRGVAMQGLVRRGDYHAGAASTQGLHVGCLARACSPVPIELDHIGHLHVEPSEGVVAPYSRGG